MPTIFGTSQESRANIISGSTAVNRKSYDIGMTLINCDTQSVRSSDADCHTDPVLVEGLSGNRHMYCSQMWVQ